MQPLWVPRNYPRKSYAFVHITYENFRCINLNTFMYLQYKYFEYGLCNVGIELKSTNSHFI